MGADVMERPLIWVLKGARAGDTAQAMALALSLGGRVESKSLRFNGRHRLPNWLGGPRISHLNGETRSLLGPPWPDLVIATGRRTAPVSLWIAKQSGGHSKTVQIGRPRMVLSAFDLVLTTPQYGLPRAENVEVLALPFTAGVAPEADDLEHFTRAWAHLPRPWTLAAIGGGKFPQRLGLPALQAYGDALEAHGQRVGGSVILVPSPRSLPEASATVAKRLQVPCWQAEKGGQNPYRAGLALCDYLSVTSDSASMLADMLMLQKPTLVYRLEVSPLVPRWSAQGGLAASLAKRGILHPPRNTDQLMAQMISDDFVGDLRSGKMATKSFDMLSAQRAVVERVKALCLR